MPEPAELAVELAAADAASCARRRSRAARSPTTRSLLALQVNGADLALDHGYPARIIVPALPGVHNTKWVGRLELRA